jgi:hypothetical protein
MARAAMSTQLAARPWESVKFMQGTAIGNEMDAPWFPKPRTSKFCFGLSLINRFFRIIPESNQDLWNHDVFSKSMTGC